MEDWWSSYLLKHIAVRSDVLKATFGGYSISISGLTRLAWTPIAA